MAEIKKKPKNHLLLDMPTALLQLLEGVGLMGALPRTFPLRGRGGRRSPLPGRISKQKLNQNRALSHWYKVAIHALGIQFHSAEKPALPGMCEKLSEAQNEAGKQAQLCLGLSSGSRDDPAAVCI